MSFLPFASSFASNAPNLSFYAIPAAWLVAIAPHFYAVALTKGKFTNSSPRQYLADVKAKAVKTEEDKKYIRAEGAQLNGFENLPLFAAAIIAGNFAGVPAHELNRLAAGYLASRVLFNGLYIWTTDELAAYLRSGAYLAGIGIIFNLFFKAAAKAK